MLLSSVLRRAADRREHPIRHRLQCSMTAALRRNMSYYCLYGGTREQLFLKSLSDDITIPVCHELARLPVDTAMAAAISTTPDMTARTASSLPLFCTCLVAPTRCTYTYIPYVNMSQGQGAHIMGMALLK